MSHDPESMDEIKRKLRNLKKLEVTIRSGNAYGAVTASEKEFKRSLVWNEFFDVNGTGKSKARYSLEHLASLSKEDFRNIINEYFFNVYYKFYMENGIVSTNMYDPEILKWMGLSPDAGVEAIKKRFRELAKKYHPDTGGDDNKFIQLMENYKKLIE